jgi:hypothetical protein
MIQHSWIKPCLRSSEKETAGQDTGIVLRCTLTHTNYTPGQHDPTHPDTGGKMLQCEGGEWLENHIRVIEYGECHGPLRGGEVAELLFDASSLFEVDDGGV